MKKISENLFSSLGLLLLISFGGAMFAQTPASRHQILMDIAHGQKFWNDPANMKGMDANIIERVKYMTDQITQNAASVGAEVGYLKGKIQPDHLAKCDLLFIHIPSSRYSADEVTAIKDYVQKGGSLFLIMDVDYWSTLQQANVNDIISPFGIRFEGQSPDSLSGGYTKAGLITEKPLKIPYHGARIVSGGTPFCFSNQGEENPFGTFMQLRSGGKMVVMGDGMVSLYMTSWNGVDGYQCLEFMEDVFAWLLK